MAPSPLPSLQERCPTSTTPKDLPPFFVLVPLYIYPTSTSWQPLYECITNNPNVTFKVIVNCNSGPDPSPYPDTNYQTAIANLNSHPNIQILGYVYVKYGTRDIGAVEADIATYAGWSDFTDADIHVGGIFFDEAPTAVSSLLYMKHVATFTKCTLSKGNAVIMNPGTVPDASYYNIADYINASEDASTVNSEGRNAALGVVPASKAHMSSIILHDYAGDVKQMIADTAAFVKEGLAGLFVTSATDYDAWAPWFGQFVQAVSSAVSMRSSSTGTRPVRAVSVRETRVRMAARMMAHVRGKVRT